MKALSTILLLTVWIIPTAPHAADACPRIVSQSPYITHTLQWMGLGDCIVGVSRYSKLDLPKTGGIFDPDHTAIAALEPDLLLTSHWTKAEIWSGLTPKGARSARLKGFGSMDEVAENIRIIGKLADVTAADEMAAQFSKQWRTLASGLQNRGQRVLLLSACSGNPYSYGKGSWLHQLFSKAGFKVVEPKRLRAVKMGEKIDTLASLIDELKPEKILLFSRKDATQCALLQSRLPIQITPLDGDIFLHPAPTLLDGLLQIQSTPF